MGGAEIKEGTENLIKSLIIDPDGRNEPLNKEETLRRIPWSHSSENQNESRKIPHRISQSKKKAHGMKEIFLKKCEIDAVDE